MGNKLSGLEKFKYCDMNRFIEMWFGVAPYEHCYTTLPYFKHPTKLYLIEPDVIFVLYEGTIKCIQQSSKHVVENGIPRYELTFTNDMILHIYHGKIVQRSAKSDQPDLNKINLCEIYMEPMSMAYPTNMTYGIHTIQSKLENTPEDVELFDELLTFDTFREQNSKLEKLFLLKRFSEYSYIYVTPNTIVEKTIPGSKYRLPGIKFTHIDYIYYLTECEIVYRSGTTICFKTFGNGFVITLDFPLSTFETVPVLTKYGTVKVSKRLLESFNSKYINEGIENGLVKFPTITKDQIIHIPTFYKRMGETENRDGTLFRRWMHEEIYRTEIRE